MKERNYTLMPARVSSIASEIESKQLLQTEQIRIASRAGDLLLYYISGGNQWPKNLPTPADKVRPEDQDLRGWFSETYTDYLTHLTSDLECSKGNPQRVKEVYNILNEYSDMALSPRELIYAANKLTNLDAANDNISGYQLEEEKNIFNRDIYTEMTTSPWLNLKDFDQSIINNEMSLSTKEKLYENGVYLEI